MLEKVDDKMTNKDQTQSNDLWAGFGSYQNYSPELVKSEQQAGRTVVYFFTHLGARIVKKPMLTSKLTLIKFLKE